MELSWNWRLVVPVASPRDGTVESRVINVLCSRDPVKAWSGHVRERIIPHDGAPYNLSPSCCFPRFPTLIRVPLLRLQPWRRTSKPRIKTLVPTTHNNSGVAILQSSDTPVGLVATGYQTRQGCRTKRKISDWVPPFV